MFFFVGLKLLNGKIEDAKHLKEKVLKYGDFSGLHVECLTDTWIGKDRFRVSLSLCLSLYGPPHPPQKNLCYEIERFGVW